MPFVNLMTSLARTDGRCSRRRALIISAIMSLVVFYPLTLEKVVETGVTEDNLNFTTIMVDPWEDGGQPWPQSGRTPGRMSASPVHDPTGSVNSLSSITDPVINWEYGNYDIGTDSLGTPIGDFSGSLQVDSESHERCGGSSLYTVCLLYTSPSPRD